MNKNPYELVKLPEVIYFQEGPGLRNWQYGTTGVPFLNIRTLKNDGFIDKSLCQFVKEEEFNNKYEHFLLDEGDYVVSSSGTLGKLAEVRQQDLPVMLNTSVIRFRSLDTSILDRSFLKWFIKSPLYFRQIEQASTGTAVKNYGPSHLKQMLIPLPPLEEQKRIAEILDKADRIRRKRQEAIRLTEELGRSIFLDMFGDPIANSKGWEKCSIQDLCSIIVDCPHSTPKYLEGSNGYPCIRTSDLQNGYLDFSTTKHVGDIEYKNRVSRHIPISGDILYSREGERFGIAARVRENLKLCLGQRMMLFQPNFSKATSAFLWSLLNSQSVYHQATESVGGSTSPHVNVKDIKKFKAFCPPLEMQVVLENIENRLDSLREKNIQDITESENLFNSLLQRAFRGEL